MTALEVEVTMTQAQVDELKKSVPDAQKWDRENSEKSRPYSLDKKRELEELITFGRILNMKLEAERIDRALPKTSMIEIVEHAQPGSRPVRPNKPLNLALGAVAGLFLGGVAGLLTGWLAWGKQRSTAGTPPTMGEAEANQNRRPWQTIQLVEEKNGRLATFWPGAFTLWAILFGFMAVVILFISALTGGRVPLRGALALALINATLIAALQVVSAKRKAAGYPNRRQSWVLPTLILGLLMAVALLLTAWSFSTRKPAAIYPSQVFPMGAALTAPTAKSPAEIGEPALSFGPVIERNPYPIFSAMDTGFRTGGSTAGLR